MKKHPLFWGITMTAFRIGIILGCLLGMALSIAVLHLFGQQWLFVLPVPLAAACIIICLQFDSSGRCVTVAEDEEKEKNHENDSYRG